jgi:hypothetical protein
VATRFASQITAHSGFSPRLLSHIGIENIVQGCLRRTGARVKSTSVTKVEQKTHRGTAAWRSLIDEKNVLNLSRRSSHH